MGSQGPVPHGSGAPSHPGWPRSEPAPAQRGPAPLHMVPLAGSQRRGRCSAQNPIVGARRVPLPGQGPAPAPALPAKGSARPDTATASSGCPAEDAARAAAVPLLSPPGQPCAEALMVLCPALNYFPDCQRRVLASSAGCDPGEPDAAAAARGANGRSTPHVEFNYWLSSLTEYIG